MRWVWADTAELYPGLLAAGIRVERCHDVTLTERLLLSREGAAGQPAYLAAAAARLHGRPVPPASRPARDGPQPSLFDTPETPQDGLAEAAATLADLVAVHADQLAAHRGGRAAGTVRAAGRGRVGGRADRRGDEPRPGCRGGPTCTTSCWPSCSGRGRPARPAQRPRPARLADLAARISAAFGTAGR